MTWRLRHEDIDILTLGSSLLGSGGGGNPYIGGLLLKKSMEKLGIDGIEVIAPDSINDDATIIASAGMGSPTIGSEKLPNGEEYARSLSRLEKDMEIEFEYVTPSEIGGANSVVPFIAALFRGLPVLDGDGEGRAFPELQMTTFNLYGISSTPMCLADERGNELIINSVDNLWAESIARSVTARFGGRGYVANYPMSGKDYKKSAVKNSVSRARDLGELLSRGMRNNSVEDVLTKEAGASELFDGKLTDLVRENNGGFSIGYAIFRSTEGEKTSRIRFQNEYLFFDEKIEGDMIEIVTTPEIICILDRETYMPITTDRLRYGQRCKVFSLPVGEKWNHPLADDLVGRRVFSVLKHFQ
ncbi:MAG: DUF917 family protein [Candidatus Thermoplasmatota archaeon]|jgi:DUF917 family protein|nr:DUF917 family protein [Candidatus Thermoplasmatota archaeon]